MLFTRTPLLVVTLVNLPPRAGCIADSSGSALWRTLSITGVSLHTRLAALLVEYWWRNLENSESVANEGWTEMMVSEERYAILATVRTHQHRVASSPSMAGL